MGINLPFIDLGGSWRGTQIAAGRYHTCCILMSNDTTLNMIKCWGYGAYGALGIGDTQSRGDGANEMGDNLPTIDLGSGFDPIQITAGDQSTCALSASNKVKCWGWNEYGKLGIGDMVDRGVSVAQMGDNLPFVALGTVFTPILIESGFDHVCALSDSGKVKCWGRNGAGQLGLSDSVPMVGDGSNEMNDSLPMVDLGSNLTATQITVGQQHTCALLTVGNIKCWGNDGKVGRLGYGTFNWAGQMGDYLPFVDLGIGFAGAVTEVKAGYAHTCATSSSNEVKCWGSGADGRLGSGSTTNIGNDANEMGDYLPNIDLGFPTINPSASPTFHPSRDPSTTPTDDPSISPTNNPTTTPTKQPSAPPSVNPTNQPSLSPTHDPSTPTKQPSESPSNNPSFYPTNHPSFSPSQYPSISPTNNPTNQPSLSPTHDPSTPTKQPSESPSDNPSFYPTNHPSFSPSQYPSISPTNNPTTTPLLITHDPSTTPTEQPSASPSGNPSLYPTNQSSASPSGNPSTPPTFHPSSSPTHDPSTSPSVLPSLSPTSATQFPSISPTQNPTRLPSVPSMSLSDGPSLSPTICYNDAALLRQFVANDPANVFIANNDTYQYENIA
eukprot:671450_1